jgi:DNA transformation protein
MTKKSEFLQYVLDQLDPVGGITSRAMFGGYGIYKDGLCFAIIACNELYFKVDDTTISDFKEQGSHPFEYEARGKKNIQLGYWTVPAEILESQHKLAGWVEKAYHVALKAKAKKKKKKK